MGGIVAAFAPADPGAETRRDRGGPAGCDSTGKAGLRVIVPHPIGEPGAILLRTGDARLYNLLLQMIYFIGDASPSGSQSASHDLTQQERLALARECIEEARQILVGAGQDDACRTLASAINELRRSAAAA